MSAHINKNNRERGWNILSYKIKKIYTDNPYVDEMVYYTKKMGIDTVLKMQQIADDNETAESLRQGGLYISCIEGTAILEIFPSISTTALQAAGIVDPLTVDICLKDRTKIPKDKKPLVAKALSAEFIENYEELNPYYRMLHGLPKIGQADYITDWMPPEGVVIDLSKPVHEMSNAEASILDTYGVLDDMINEDPINRQYMHHLGKKRIDYYLARRANRFDPLYIPSVDSDSIYKMYKDKLDENKFYVLRTVYSEAFKYESDYYDNFIAIFIVLITMIDIISRVQEFVARKEIFDIRSVQYIFKSYGVPFFEQIPLKFQIAMVKNLHTLLKYKSTAKCMVDICSLFGFKNIKIFKYYLLKDRRIDLTTNEYIYATDGEGNEDLEAEYELKFLKLPLEEDTDEHIRKSSSYADYDEITSLDAKWDGGLDHDLVISEILKQEFNFVRTKYISIDTIYEIAKMSAQQSYFFNFLYDNMPLETMVTVQVPYIEPGKEFMIADIFTLLTVLTYYYNGIKDTIMDTHSKVLYVNGFNFKADLAKLAAEIAPKKLNDIVVDPGSTLHAREQLEKFQIPTTSIPTFNEMMDIYVNNMEVRDELIKGMQESDNKDVFDVYKKLYDALMTVQLTMDYYKNPETGDFYRDSTGDATYTEYLKNKDQYLYSVIVLVQEFEDETSRNQYIANLIDSIIYALEEYIDTEEFQSLFANLPVMSAESVKQYIATVINFYKSYKVDFLGINTIYVLDDKVEGIIRLIDDLEFERYFERPEFVEICEEISKIHVDLSRDEKINLIEKIYLDIYRWIEKHYDEDIKLSEKIISKLVSLVLESAISVSERVFGIDTSMIEFEDISLYCEILATSMFDYEDGLDLKDKLWIYDERDTPSPFMSKVAPTDEGRIITASEFGDSSPSSRISVDRMSTVDDNVVTEKVVDDYVQNTAVGKEDVVKASEFNANKASEDKLLSEKAILDALRFHTL